MSNLIPTPIVDKNGVATTRNKRPTPAAKSNSRIASLERKKVEGVPGRLVELGAKNADGKMAVYVDGESIGFAEQRSVRVQTGKKMGLIAAGYKQVNRWFVKTEPGSDVKVPTPILDQGHVKIEDAVIKYVRDYDSALKAHNDRKDFIARGGEFFKYVVGGRGPKFRDKEIVVNNLHEITTGTPGVHGSSLSVGSGEKSYRIELNGPESRVVFGKGDFQTVFAFDHNTGQIIDPDPDEAGFHDILKSEQGGVYEHAAGILSQMYS